MIWVEALNSGLVFMLVLGLPIGVTVGMGILVEKVVVSGVDGVGVGVSVVVVMVMVGVCVEVMVGVGVGVTVVVVVVGTHSPQQ